MSKDYNSKNVDANYLSLFILGFGFSFFLFFLVFHHLKRDEEEVNELL